MTRPVFRNAQSHGGPFRGIFVHPVSRDRYEAPLGGEEGGLLHLERLLTRPGRAWSAEQLAVGGGMAILERVLDGRGEVVFDAYEWLQEAAEARREDGEGNGQ